MPKISRNAEWYIIAALTAVLYIPIALYFLEPDAYNSRAAIITLPLTLLYLYVATVFIVLVINVKNFFYYALPIISLLTPQLLHAIKFSGLYIDTTASPYAAVAIGMIIGLAFLHKRNVESTSLSERIKHAISISFTALAFALFGLLILYIMSLVAIFV